MKPSTPAPADHDPAHDVFGHPGGPLDALFAPRSVAVIGASEAAGSVGRAVLWNLVSHPFGGTVFPINARRRSVLGIKAYPSVAALPERPELAVVLAPPPAVPRVLEECADAGARAAIVLSSGTPEVGPDAAARQGEILAIARRSGMRVLGPDCAGLMSPLGGLTATATTVAARPGSVALLSQSAAMLSSILDWSYRELVGFSTIVSVGSMVDVGFGDLIEHLGEDQRTRSILIFMESVGDAPAFLSAARKVALTKPIIVLKAGRTAASRGSGSSGSGGITGAQAAGLAGSDEVLEAAFRRSGVLRVDRISDLFDMAEVLSSQPRPAGPRLAIVTNAGGPGLLAADALVEGGGALAALSDDSRAALDAVLPPSWSHRNPIDVLGDADPARYTRALEIAARDPGSDGLLVILTPHDAADPTRTAEALRAQARLGKPVLASWMGGPSVQAGEAILNQAGIPTFAFPDAAARAFNYMWRYNDNLLSLYETPALPGGDADPDPAGRARARAQAEEILAAARAEGRSALTEAEARELLACYGITVAKDIAKDGEDGAKDREGREEGYELFVGSAIDAQLGPVLTFGAAGQELAPSRDRALALPPLNTTLAQRMMEQTRVHELLQGARGGPPVDLSALECLLVRFADMIVEQPWLREVELRPLVASPARIVARGARVALHDPALTPEELPRTAIRPYPSQYVTREVLRDGTEVTIRPIRPEDEPLMVRFHETLSERSVRFRYMQWLRLEQRIGHERLIRVCFNDYDRDLALVVVRRDPATRQCEIIAVGRLVKAPGRREAEFALLVSDPFQGRGLGTALLRRVLEVARAEGLARVTASILPENHEMQRICQKFGFRLLRNLDDPEVAAVLDLGSPGPGQAAA